MGGSSPRHSLCGPGGPSCTTPTRSRSACVFFNFLFIYCSIFDLLSASTEMPNRTTRIVPILLLYFKIKGLNHTTNHNNSKKEWNEEWWQKCLCACVRAEPRLVGGGNLWQHPVFNYRDKNNYRYNNKETMIAIIY